MDNEYLPSYVDVVQNCLTLSIEDNTYLIRKQLAVDLGELGVDLSKVKTKSDLEKIAELHNLDIAAGNKEDIKMEELKDYGVVGMIYDSNHSLEVDASEVKGFIPEPEITVNTYETFVPESEIPTIDEWMDKEDLEANVLQATDIKEAYN